MQKQVTIQLLGGSVMNDVLYIQLTQDGLGRSGKVTDRLLAVVKGQLWWEPRLHPAQVLTQPKLGSGQGPRGPLVNGVVGHLQDPH